MDSALKKMLTLTAHKALPAGYNAAGDPDVVLSSVESFAVYHIKDDTAQITYQDTQNVSRDKLICESVVTMEHVVWLPGDFIEGDDEGNLKRFRSPYSVERFTEPMSSKFDHYEVVI